ncbi:MAG: hypothetical protein AAF614_16800 [Chloroflexota bacterium]
MRDLEIGVSYSKNTIHRHDTGKRLPENMDAVRRYANTLECTSEEREELATAYIFSCLLNIGMQSEEAIRIVQNNHFTPNDMDSLMLAADEAIKRGAFAEATIWLHAAKKLHRQIEKLAMPIEMMLGEAAYGAGHLRQASKHFENALTQIGLSRPKSKVGILFDLVKQLSQYFLYRFVLRLPKRSYSEKEKIGLHSGDRLTHAYFVNNDKLLTAYYVFKGLNHVESLADSLEVFNYRARFYAKTAVICGAVKLLQPFAEQYIEAATEAMAIGNDPYTQSIISTVIGMYYYGQGDWQKVVEFCEDGIEAAREIHHWRHEAEASALIASTHYYWKSNWQLSFASYDVLEEEARKYGDEQIQGLIQVANGLKHLHSGNLKEAQSNLQRANSLAMRAEDEFLLIVTGGLLGQVFLRQGEIDLAEHHADLVIKKVMHAPLMPGNAEGLRRAVEYHLFRAEQSPSHAHLEQAKQACQRLKNYAELFPRSWPMYHAYKGWYYWLVGRYSKAAHHGIKGCQIANQLEIYYDEGVGYYLLGRNILRHTANKRHEALAHLKAARTILLSLDAVYELEEIERLLA